MSIDRKQLVQIGVGGRRTPGGGRQGRKINNEEETDTLFNVFECVGDTLVFHSTMISQYRRISDRNKERKANIKTR